MTKGRNPKSPEVGPGRLDRLIQEHEHDTYKVRGKLSDPTACSVCGVLYRDGRWVWGDAPADASPTICPACRRIQDDYPGGFLKLKGAFLQAHREELEGLMRNVEQREKGLRPLKRIMDIVDEDDGVLVTTTDPRLARNIGDALESAYEGELDYQYSDEGNILRVTWTR